MYGFQKLMFEKQATIASISVYVKCMKNRGEGGYGTGITYLSGCNTETYGTAKMDLDLRKLLNSSCHLCA
jgi:hypothetical protein